MVLKFRNPEIRLQNLAYAYPKAKLDNPISESIREQTQMTDRVKALDFIWDSALERVEMQVEAVLKVRSKLGNGEHDIRIA